jgi:hypothetical protein
MIDAEKFEKLMDDLRIERHSPKWIDCGIVWHMASAAGMTRAAEIAEAQGRMSESIDGNSFYIAIGQAADAIRVGITREE